ncbi:hypothetical protein M0R45_004116 [Rubus argutus]|uniref:Uncharacterized protein n=1 Tax=Rubus argutus TaxID=59490 RepID=A0AAW1YIU7_RUBAR
MTASLVSFLLALMGTITRNVRLSSEEARLGMAVGREMAAAAHGGAGQLSGVALVSRVEEARGWLDCDGGCDS